VGKTATSRRSTNGESIVSVVVPTYNEAENIPRLVDRIASVLKDIEYEIIVVDDNSPDKTWKVAEELSKKGYPIRVIRRIGERGLGTAIVRGIREARGKYIVVMDADLQHPPETIPALIREAEEASADIVVASRYAKGGGVRGWSRTRLLISKTASLIAYILLAESRRTSDPMSGFFLVRKSLTDKLHLEGRSWKVLLEILAKAPWAKVSEVPYVFEKRLHGESKLGFKAMLEFVLDLLRLSEYRVLKFVTVGASGTVVNLLVLWITKGVLGLSEYIAFPLAFETSLTWNFTLHDKWTFHGKRRRKGVSGWISYWLRYHCAALGSMISYLSIGIGLTRLGVNYLVAGLLGIIVGFLANYMISQYGVWSLHSLDKSEAYNDKH
jgi:dolichol-phosphate mannosyltransferase